MVTISDLKNLTMYKKSCFLPIDEDDKKKNSVIMLLTPNYKSSIECMNSTYMINRKYFQSYYLEKSVFQYINQEGYLVSPNDDDTLFQVSEANLSSGDRKKLPDSDFGLPKQRRYPMPDEKHVLLAIRMFNHVEEEYEKELAGNITKKIKHFQMQDQVHVSEKNRYYKYWIKDFPQKISSKNEAVEDDDDIAFSYYFSDEIKKKFQDTVNMADIDDEAINERMIINDKDIYYNKKAFDNKEINLCFITGLSGSGKSTMAHEYDNKKNIEVYELDDALANKISFTMDNLKEYGQLIYTFFNGPGKKYFYTKEDVENGTVKGYDGDYDRDLVRDFVNYAIRWANSHKNIQYIIEGVWLYLYMKPEELKDFAVYIKGTSVLISAIRGTKRNRKNDKYKGERVGAKTTISMFIKQLKGDGKDEKLIVEWRKYFSSINTNEAANDPIHTCSMAIIKDKRILVLCNKNGQFSLPGGRVDDGESNPEALTRIATEQIGVSITDSIQGYEFYYGDENNVLYDDILYLVKSYEGDIKASNKYKYAKFLSVERILYSHNISKPLQRFITQYSKRLANNPDDYMKSKIVDSNIVYTGPKNVLETIKRYINQNILKQYFDYCEVKYPKFQITVIASDKADYSYIDERNITVLTPDAFVKEFRNEFSYSDYTKFVMCLYVYHTVNDRCSDKIINPLALYKSGTIDDIIDDDKKYQMEYLFKRIDETYGNRAIISIVKNNDFKALLNYAREFSAQSYRNELMQYMSDAIDEAENKELKTVDDVSNIGTRITRRIKNASVYKLNKIVRDIQKGNVGKETRGTKTDLQKIKDNDVGTTDVKSMSDNSGGENETPQDQKNTTEESYYPFTYDDDIHKEYLVDENVIYFFEDAVNYNLALRQALYNDRIRNVKQVLAIYRQVKEDCGYIRYTFTDIPRYDGKNLFFDTSYYNEAFFKNLAEKDDPTSIKNLKVYAELMRRLLNDSRLSSYKKKTVFIPVLDWRSNESTMMWMYKDNINPISIIYFMMRKNPQYLIDLFGNTDIIFMGSKNYFKLNFSEVEIDGPMMMRFIMMVRRITELGAGSNPDPDPSDEPEHSAKGIALDLVDKVEKSQNIEIKSVKPIMAIQEPDNPANIKDYEFNIAAKKVEAPVSDTEPTIDRKKEREVLVRGRGPETVIKQTAEINKTKEDIEKSTKMSNNTNAVNAPNQEKDKEHLVNMIAKAAVQSSTPDEAMDRLDDEEFKKLLIDIAEREEDNTRISKSRAAKMTEMSNQFRQKQVNGKSVKDLLEQNPNDIELPATELPVASIDDTWKSMTFMNFDKYYDPDSDIVKMLDSMKDWSYPIVVKDLEVKDNSTSEDYVNLWRIECEDYKGSKFTLKVDIPKFINDKFLKLRGNMKNLMIQSTLMPIIKTDFDTCQVIGVGGYNKIFIRRFGSGDGKSMPIVNKLIKTVSKCKDKSLKVVLGDNSKICNKYELPIDYIDLAGYFDTIENDRYIIYFNQDELRKQYEVDDSKGLPIAVEKDATYKEAATIQGDRLVYYNPSKDYPTVANYLLLLIAAGLSDQNAFYNLYTSTIVTGKKYMYSRAKIFKTQIPVIVICAYLEGLTSTMRKAGITYRFVQELDKETRVSDVIDYIEFSDGYLIYDVNYSSTMLMNGLKDCDTASYSLKNINAKDMYMDFLDEFGGNMRADGLENSYDCMLDPITKEILEIYKLPTDYVSVLIYASDLLADNKFISHKDYSVRRLRRKELIAGYFYKVLTTAYQDYANQIRHSRKSVKMSVKQSAVIDILLSKDPATTELSVNNAINDLECSNTVTNKGLVGMNSDRAYSLDKRGYDDSMLNILGMSTNFSGAVGINRQATIDCNIMGARGFVKPIDGNTEKFDTAKTLTITEALTPFGSTHDDPFRTLMSQLQTSKHMVRTDVSDPMLVTNGADEALPYMVSDIFAFKAKQNGKVIEKVDDPKGRNSYMIIEYKDGSHEIVNLSESIEHNGDGGYYVPMKLDTDLKVGSRVKASQVVAYDKSSFSNSIGESGNIAANVGTLAKVALMNTDEGFEDSCAITSKFAKKLGTTLIYKEEIKLDKNVNVFLMKKIGEPVTEGDTILSYQNSFDDDVATSLLRNLSMNAEEISELGRNPVKTKHTGVLEDIKIYRTVALEELSPSLQKLCNMVEGEIRNKKKVYDKYDIDSATLPPTTKVPQVGKTKNVQDGVLIEFYIKGKDTMAIGDKVVFYSANKGILKYIIDEGKEPYTDFRPEEKIDAFISIGSINGRMVMSPVIYGSLSKLMVELDRSCKDLAGIPYDHTQV